MFFFTELIKITPIAANTINNKVKITKFDDIGNTTSLYVENLMIVDSITATTVKVNMKTSETFLVRLVDKELISLSFTIRSQ